MDNLPVPDRHSDADDLRIAIAVVERAGNISGYPASEEELLSVLQIYDDYDRNAGVGAAIDLANLDAEMLSCIQNAYKKTYRNGALAHLRSVLQSKVDRCPICGIGPAKELDHYLPKSDYQVFSIYIRNLVPICHDCNNSKKTHGTDEAETRFIHAYFDKLPDVHLKADFAIEQGAVLINFVVPDLGPAEKEVELRLCYQLQRLNLSSRWSDEFIICMSAHERALELSFEANGAEGVSDFLSKQAVKEECRFGRSHWRPVLLRTLSESDEFCDGGFARVLCFDGYEPEAHASA